MHQAPWVEGIQSLSSKGICKDANWGLWGRTLKGTPENVGGEPARALVTIVGGAPKLIAGEHCWCLQGIGAKH